MFSIVAMQYTSSKCSTVIIGVRFEDIYEDIRNIKAYNTIELARSVFEDKIYSIKKGIV